MLHNKCIYLQLLKDVLCLKPNWVSSMFVWKPASRLANLNSFTEELRAVPARQTWDCQVKPGAWQEAKKHKDILSGSQIRLGQSYSRLPCRLRYGARCLAWNKSLSSEKNNRQPGRRPVPDRLGRPLGFHSSRLIRRFLSCCSNCSLLFCSKRLCSCQFNYTEH